MCIFSSEETAASEVRAHAGSMPILLRRVTGISASFDHLTSQHRHRHRRLLGVLLPYAKVVSSCEVYVQFGYDTVSGLECFWREQEPAGRHQSRP